MQKAWFQSTWRVMFMVLAMSVPAWAQTLEGFAVLPADTFAPGPTSGQFIMPANGRTPPFVNKQPVQGLSAVLNNHDGTFWVMCDNGYGSIESSADFELRVYRIRPDFKTQKDGSGTIQVLEHITLRDPRIICIDSYPAMVFSAPPTDRNQRLPAIRFLMKR